MDERVTPLEQLAEYCNCVDVEEKDVNELISLISTYTCWTQKPCETFLQMERKEVIDLPDCVCDCDVFTFEPFYRPFEVDSFTFTLVEQNGIQDLSSPITDYIYSEADENFRLILGLPNCGCRPHCGCESKYKLVVTYIAGYESIPECLLPVFCDALQWIREKNKCDCEQCAECTTEYTKREPYIDYTSLEGHLQDHFLRILTVQYFRNLSLISLCNVTRHLWGVVV